MIAVKLTVAVSTIDYVEEIITIPYSTSEGLGDVMIKKCVIRMTSVILESRLMMVGGDDFVPEGTDNVMIYDS